MADKSLRIGVVLSGCGVYDGTEIHEAVCTLLAIAGWGRSRYATLPTFRRPMSSTI